MQVSITIAAALSSVSFLLYGAIHYSALASRMGHPLTCEGAPALLCSRWPPARRAGRTVLKLLLPCRCLIRCARPPRRDTLPTPRDLPR